MRKVKSGVSKVGYRCHFCYWGGDTPNVKPSKEKVFIISVKYEEILKNLIAGDTIKEQQIKYGVNGNVAGHGQKQAIKNKIWRVYAAYAEYTKIPSTDPNLVKIKVSEDVRHLVISAIQEEETKIRNSPRLSISFSK